MDTKPPRPDIGRYRADMAKLLTKMVAKTRNLERRLDISGGSSQPLGELDLDADPAPSLRIIGTVLLRKARIHVEAVLRANESNNLHSLAVQMRPVLECAGQAVFFFHHSMIAPDLEMEPARAWHVVGDRLDADHYQTLRRRSKGDITPEEQSTLTACTR